MLSRGMQNRRDILTKNFLRGSERQRLKTGNNTIYGPSEINGLSDMQVLEAIFLEIWRLRCQVFFFFKFFIEMELISKTRLCSFQLYSKRTQLPICITLLTTLLFLFFSISSVHVSFGISFMSLSISLWFFLFSHFEQYHGLHSWKFRILNIFPGE